MKSVLSIAAACLSVLVAACASTPAPTVAAPPAELFADDAFGAPSHAIDASQLFALSPAMRRYLDVDIAAQLRSRGRQRGLVEALQHKAQLRLEFDTDHTRTAAEAFEARAGNCLSLVLMTAALAKHLELPIQFQALIGQETWSRSGDLSIVNGHVNLTVANRLIDRVGPADHRPDIRLEFGALPAGRGAALEVVSETTIVAMFMNNRSAEALVRGVLADAYAYARAGIAHDPAYAATYNTLGVIYQRREMPQHAERAYQAALDREADNRPALVNLARLFDTQGRQTEAQALHQRLARLESEPPFMHFDLGRTAVQAGDYRAAREHFLREMKRDPDYHEFHFWLAVALAGLGDVAQAREHLGIAMKNSTTRRDVALYASKLERIAPTATQLN